MTEEQDFRDNEATEVVATAGPAEAQMIEEMLRKNGIDCALQGDVASTPFPGMSDLGSVSVCVPRHVFARAKEMVDAFFAPVGKDELVEGAAELGVEDPDEPAGFNI